MADDDDLVLSPAALEALAGFYNDRDAREKQFQDLKSQAENQHEKQKLSMDVFGEDWNASQFWYSDETASLLARQLLEGTDNRSSIAVVSAPSVFVQLKNMLVNMDENQRPLIQLFEYDERFSVFKEFVAYDYAQPLKLPGELKGRFDRVICDPPFLSDDCQTKAAITVRWLSKSLPSDTASNKSMATTYPGRLVICTGERMSRLISKLYQMYGIKSTDLNVIHSKGLSNEFKCYANFECEHWKFQQEA